MRKLLASLSLATLLLVLVSTSVLAGGVIKVGADVGGESEIKVTAAGGTSLSVNADTKTGISIGGEYFFDLNDDLAIGAGIEYQLNRKYEVEEIGFNFNFIPLYALGRYHISQDFYLTGKIGYNLLQFEENPDGAKPKGGLYYGFGGGLIFSDRYQLEILYSIHNGRFEPEEDPGVDYKVTYKYSKIGLTVGYKF